MKYNIKKLLINNFDVYEENKDIFKQKGNLINWLTGVNLSQNPLEIVISTTAQLGKVISKISLSLKLKILKSNRLKNFTIALALP